MSHTRRCGTAHRRLRRRCAFLLVVLGLILAGCAHRDARLQDTTQRAMWSTYPLITTKASGTAFVVVCRDAKGNAVPTVVTAGHLLASNGQKPLFVGTRFLDTSGEPQGFLLPCIPVVKKTAYYAHHPQQDVAAFALRLPMRNDSPFSVQSFIHETSLSRQRKTLKPGTEVMFAGFPDILPGTSGALPVLRTGAVATNPETGMERQGLFVINADVYPGDSGAPVFLRRHKGRPELVGVVISRLGTDPKAFSHFAVAVDVTGVRETLQLLRSQEAGTFAGDMGGPIGLSLSPMEKP